jgi:hypothetical protein
LPDYWGAANRVNETRQSTSLDPVMVTVASIDTHLSQPSHKRYQLSEHTLPHEEASSSNSDKGVLWRTTADALSNSRDGRRSGQQLVRPLKRNLTGEERQGAYILLALLGSSWLLSGIIERLGKTKDRP